MGILVSWFNPPWPFPDTQLTDLSDPDIDQQRNTLSSPVHPRSFDLATDNAIPSLVHAEQPTPTLNPTPSSLANTISSLKSSAPTSPRDPFGASSSFPAPAAQDSDTRQHLFVSSDYDKRVHSVPMTGEAPEVANTSGPRPSAPSGSPPPPPHQTLRIDVAAANDPTMDHEMIDASFVRDADIPDPSSDLYFDDEGLSALEKIYLYARSNASFHRYVKFRCVRIIRLRHA